MAAPMKYPAAVRDRVHQLCNEERQTSPDVRKALLAEGIHNPPDEATIRRLASEERRKRGSVQDMARDEALDTLTRRLFSVADKEIRRMERAKDVDANALLTMAKALRELQPLASTKPQTDDKPKGLLDTLHTNPSHVTHGPVTARVAA